MKTAKGEFIAIFDADFVPPEDFLMRTIHHLTDPKIGMVQTRWTHINRNYSFLTEVEAILLDGHFVLEHSARARSNAFFNFNGTAGVWRRSAIEEAGGWQHDTLTEDTDLSYRAQLKGWKFIYLQDVECPAELPVEMTAFKTQQARWAKGLIQTAQEDTAQRVEQRSAFSRKAGSLVPPDCESELPLDGRALRASAARDDHPLLPGMVPDVVHRYAAVPGFHVFDFQLLPGIAAGAVSETWPRALIYLPFLMALGIGFTITNSRAVLEALLGSSRFRAYAEVSCGVESDQINAAKYRAPPGLGALGRRF